MKRLATGIGISAVSCLAAFAAGAEWGHRRGYERGWRDCKNDAKEAMGMENGERFWFWHGRTPVAIRRKPSLLFD